MTTIADYRVLGPAGAGTTGSFHVAEPPARLGLTVPTVILKVVHGVQDEATFRRVARELRTFAAVRSDHLVTLYDAGQDGEHFYYSMEHLPLGSLASPARPLSRGEVIRAVRHASLAAHDLHEAGLAHRDIRPATVLLHEHGAKLADLGLVQTLNPDQTVTGLAGLESVEFIDRAVINGARASRSADVFSLGATLHRALTGEGLYGYLPPNEPLVAVRRVISSEPTVADSLDPAIRDVVERCIRTDPTERYQSAAALAAALRPFEEEGDR